MAAGITLIMQRKILIIFSFLFLVSSAYAQTRTKYTPKLPNFFEGTKPRGELISVGQIVATKVDNNQTPDSFAVTENGNQKELMGNPLGILPKKAPIITTTQEAPQQQEPKDETTTELEQAVSEARSVSEEIRQAMGGNPDYTNPKQIDKFVNASEKALQRGQLRAPEKKQAEQDYKF